MAEWPKQYWEDAWIEAVSGDPIEVIPADLGRELYEALRPREARPDDEERMSAALARYEREVGS